LRFVFAGLGIPVGALAVYAALEYVHDLATTAAMPFHLPQDVAAATTGTFWNPLGRPVLVCYASDNVVGIDDKLITASTTQFRGRVVVCEHG
jgi:hypothetical protein